MWFAHCVYLVPSLEPPGWKEDPVIRKKFNEAMKNSKIEATVKRNIENRGRLLAASSTTLSSLSTTPATDRTVLSANYLTYYTALSVYHSAYAIPPHLIHDTGSNVHVCHSNSAHLYTKLRDANMSPRAWTKPITEEDIEMTGDPTPRTVRFHKAGKTFTNFAYPTPPRKARKLVPQSIKDLAKVHVDRLV